MNRFLRHALAVVLITTVAFGVFSYLITGENLIERSRFYLFDPAIWEKATPPQRYYMARFLIDQNLLIGKTKSQIVQMLGGSKTGSHVAYHLGPEHGTMFRIDDDWLHIQFDDESSDSLAISAGIHSD